MYSCVGRLSELTMRGVHVRMVAADAVVLSELTTFTGTRTARPDVASTVASIFFASQIGSRRGRLERRPPTPIIGSAPRRNQSHCSITALVEA